MVLGKYVKCENENDVNYLKKYVKQHKLYRYGPTNDHIYNLPFYYKVCKKAFEGSWQDIEDNGNWWSEEGFKSYNEALPIDALYHPENYPEYFI